MLSAGGTSSANALTPLLAAAQHNHARAIEALLAAKADVEQAAPPPEAGRAMEHIEERETLRAEMHAAHLEGEVALRTKLEAQWAKQRKEREASAAAALVCDDAWRAASRIDQ